MAKECIHTTSQWGKFHIPHYDPTFVVTNPNVLGMGRLDIARVKLIFAFTYDGKTYPCALVHWFSKIGEEPDFNTGMHQENPNLT